ncbi:MAG: phage tail family protein [Armatimonadota bacterium]|nr:phage tail family protein [Armatimonadota bacterium]
MSDELARLLALADLTLAGEADRSAGSFWQVLIPETTTNKVLNPSAETTGNFVARNVATVTRSTTYSCFGYNSYWIQNAAFDGGLTLTLSALSSLTHVVSFYVYGPLPNTWQIGLSDAVWMTPSLLSSKVGGGWYHYGTVFSAAQSNGSTTLHIRQGAGSAPNIYVDGVQVEAKTAYNTVYCDGDQEGCTWTGTVHGSTSTRSSQSRAGGRWRDFYDDYGIGIVGMVGFGMPDLQHNVTPYSILPGAFLQSIKTKTRDFALIMEPQGGSLTTLHTKRDYVIEAVKPDLVSPLQPVRLKYTGATTEVVIAAHYAGGLEGNFDGEKGVQERFGVKFVAYDPYFEQTIDSAVSLTTKLSIANADMAIKKIDGTWSLLGAASAINGQIHAIAEASDGSIYLGGYFTNVGDANGDYIVKYNPAANTWSSLGTGTNDAVFGIALGADGAVYACGQFTLAGGIANTAYIAKWNGSAWSALGTGANDYVNKMAIDQSGNLYAVGGFSQMGGIANTNNVAKWNGTTWSALITGLAQVGWAIVIGLDGSIYIGGTFTNLGDANGDYIVKWNGSAWSSLGTGMNNIVYALSIDSAGNLYAGGAFTTAGGIAANYIAKWNGTSWSALGSGVNATVWSLDSINELLYVSGVFTTAGGIALADRIAVWNGSSWFHLDGDLPGSTVARDMLINADGDIYIGYDTTGTASASALTTITNNGTTIVYPQLIIKRSGGTSATLEWLKNETTGKTIWFNYALLDGETLTIDFTPGNKGITSSIFGNIIGRALLPGSDFSTWALQPGSNSVSFFIADAGTPTLTAYLLYRDQYLSPDGAIS